MDDRLPSEWNASPSLSSRGRFAADGTENILSDIADLKGGFAFKSEDYTDSGRFILRTLNIRDDGRISRVGAKFISESNALEYSRFILHPEDTLFVMVGATLGKVGFVKECDLPALLNQNMWVIRSKDSNITDPRYLYYWFQLIVRETLHWASGSARAFVRRDDYRNLPFPAIEITTQRAIASILGSLDDKIELNRKINRTLEQMAAAIFKAWFVDFEPVRSKASGADSFPGMPQPVFDALPSTFADSELGPIPEGWEVKPLPDMIEVNPKRSLKKGERAPHLEMKNMPTQGHAPKAWGERPFGSGMKFNNGDTLVARITPCLENGKTAFVDFLDANQTGWGSTEYIVLRPIEPLPKAFAYCLARTTSFRDFAVQNMTGTSGRQRVSATALNHYELTKPLPQLAVAFGERIAPLFALIKAHMDESRTLAKTRDALLPKLLSGEIRIPQAEQLVEEIA